MPPRTVDIRTCTSTPGSPPLLHAMGEVLGVGPGRRFVHLEGSSTTGERIFQIGGNGHALPRRFQIYTLRVKLM